MSKGKRSLRPLGAGDDYPHLLRLLDDGKEFVNLDLARRSQKLKAETAPDHRCCRQGALFILVKPLQATADDEANIFRNVDFVDLDGLAELAGFIEDLSLFDEMPVHLLNEEWVSLALLKDETHQACRSLSAA